MPDGDVIVGTLYAGVAGLWGYIAAVALFSMVTPTSAKIGKNRTLGWTAAMETHMKAWRPEQARELEELPNIGRAIAADLRAVGIMEPRQLAELAPLSVYLRLGAVMGKRQDPCVLYTLLAARHFLDSGEARPWWLFTAEGRRLLRDAER